MPYASLRMTEDFFATKDTKKHEKIMSLRGRSKATDVAISGVSDDFQTSLVVQLKLAKVSEILTLRSE